MNPFSRSSIRRACARSLRRDARAPLGRSDASQKIAPSMDCCARTDVGKPVVGESAGRLFFREMFKLIFG